VKHTELGVFTKKDDIVERKKKSPGKAAKYMFLFAKRQDQGVSFS
jgi:hypothetical protein